MPLREHINNTFKLTPSPSPWPRMILCSLSVGLPLILGLWLGDLRASMFGALFGFILILNDHFGPYKQRIIHLMTCYFSIVVSFLLGIALADYQTLFIIVLFIFSFAIGMTKDKGIELERMFLISTLQLLMAAQTPQLQGHYATPVFYTSIAFLNYVVCLTIVFLVMKHTPNFMNRKRETFKKIIGEKSPVSFALTYAITVCLGLLIAKYFRFDHDYWVAGTILIVMMPDHYQSIYRGAQRLLGTIIGVVIASLMIKFAHDPVILIAFSMIFAFFTPLGQIRNFWIGNAFIAGLILFLIELGNATHLAGDFDLAILRIKDIGLGCFIGIFVTILTHPEIIYKKTKKPE